MLKAVFLALSLVAGAAACNGILGNTESSATDDHLFDPAGTDDAATDASMTNDAGNTFDAASSNDADEASTLIDAGSDVTAADAASIPCGAPSLVNTCLDCPGKALLCDGGCVASCRGGCGGTTGSPIECEGCNAAGVRDIAVCESAANAAACLAGHLRCTCAGGVAACPGATQVCMGGSCYACGESATDGLACKTGNCDNQFNGNRYSCN